MDFSFGGIFIYENCSTARNVCVGCRNVGDNSLGKKGGATLLASPHSRSGTKNHSMLSQVVVMARSLSCIRHTYYN